MEDIAHEYLEHARWQECEVPIGEELYGFRLGNPFLSK
ncbi:hypothetical protein [Mesorhizobium sp. 131-3-5]